MKTFGNYHRQMSSMCLWRASQHLRFYNCLLSFLVQIRDMSKLTSPSMNHFQLKRYFSFYCSTRSPSCARTFLCQMYTSLTRRSDNFVMIMASNHPPLVMLYTHLLRNGPDIRTTAKSAMLECKKGANFSIVCTYF